ncbi:MAG TPA: DUF1653 domain-containing protein [Lachnospiraceae bacterium]|uniref:DUF1653 domain-containing protein n=1 Tax=Anaerosporobacter sp. TaxID=1872529 RepID=UPI000EEC5B0E|nr:DUF1653 domain-containing protein [Anaerosporobacter sp.]HAB59344.1 DUF1653 domain-containing protein [Lachnospiraceae bacterium]
MQNREIIVPGTLMKHFKGMLYQIVSIAIHSETREEYVVYQALYGDFKTYIRPLDMFLSEVDHEKYPDVTQKYRFEVYMPEKTVEKSTSSVPVEESSELDAMLQEIHLQHSIKTKESESVDTHQALLDFLDARSHQDKLEQLDLMKKHVDSHIVNSMAISMDIVLATDTVEEQLEEIRNCLLTHIRFEDRRLR